MRWGGIKTDMHLGSLLVVFVTAIAVVQGVWPFETLTNVVRNYFSENCPERSEIIQRIENLNVQLEKLLIGQPLVHRSLYSLLKNHLSGSPQKPLVISMHGWTGNGKNFASQILAETLYEGGMENGNVHLFSGRLNFPLSTAEAVNEYKVNLHKWIRGNVSRCPLSTFIFDEIDKVPSEVIDAVKPFLDYYSSLDGVDYRNSIFVFISNVGGNLITKRYLELWESGISRDKMEYKHFEPALRKSLYNTKGAFHGSAILVDHLVSLYLPFFPMERAQVHLCILREMIRQRVEVSEESVQKVLDSMEFFNGRFSVSGCKRVSDQVALLKYAEKDEL